MYAVKAWEVPIFLYCLIFLAFIADSEMPVHTSTALMLSFTLKISFSLFMQWFCLDSQSAMYSSRVCLHNMCTGLCIAVIAAVLSNPFFENGHQCFVICNYADFI